MLKMAKPYAHQTHKSDIQMFQVVSFLKLSEQRSRLDLAYRTLLLDVTSHEHVYESS